MRLALKSSVQLTNLQPEMVIAVLVIIGILDQFGSTLTITSANDSQHKPNSLHFSGNALDFRTKDMFNILSNSQRQYELNMLRSTLAQSLPGFDVVLESVNLPNEHMHVEWDPKWITPASQTLKI